MNHPTGTHATARVACTLALATLVAVPAWSAEVGPAAGTPSVVFVHGAFADGSSWDEVIPFLQAEGLDVRSVQNPLTSLADDVAATTRAIHQMSGPVVLVGHSWGGTVISEAGNDEQVAALVYVAAFAPDGGQTSNDLTAGAPPPPWAEAVVVDEGGFLTLTPEAVATYFAQDLPADRTRVMAVKQGPVAIAAFDDPVTQAAWRHEPSWFVVPGEDHMIDPALQETLAARMGATVTRVDGSHVPMLSHPDVVAAVILDAVRQVGSGAL